MAFKDEENKRPLNNPSARRRLFDEVEEEEGEKQSTLRRMRWSDEQEGAMIVQWEGPPIPVSAGQPSATMAIVADEGEDTDATTFDGEIITMPSDDDETESIEDASTDGVYNPEVVLFEDDIDTFFFSSSPLYVSDVFLPPMSSSFDVPPSA